MPGEEEEEEEEEEQPDYHKQPLSQRTQGQHNTVLNLTLIFSKEYFFLRDLYRSLELFGGQGRSLDMSGSPWSYF